MTSAFSASHSVASGTAGRRSRGASKRIRHARGHVRHKGLRAGRARADLRNPNPRYRLEGAVPLIYKVVRGRGEQGCRLRWRGDHPRGHSLRQQLHSPARWRRRHIGKRGLHATTRFSDADIQLHLGHLLVSISKYGRSCGWGGGNFFQLRNRCTAIGRRNCGHGWPLLVGSGGQGRFNIIINLRIEF